MPQVDFKIHLDSIVTAGGGCEAAVMAGRRLGW